MEGDSRALALISARLKQVEVRLFIVAWMMQTIFHFLFHLNSEAVGAMQVLLVEVSEETVSWESVWGPYPVLVGEFLRSLLAL